MHLSTYHRLFGIGCFISVVCVCVYANDLLIKLNFFIRMSSNFWEQNTEKKKNLREIHLEI